jgi:peptidoglycan-N-acetylglucosamine deacetylase
VGDGLGEEPSPFFRFPFFSNDEQAEQYLMTKQIVIWDRDIEPYDFNYQDEQSLIDKVFDLLKDRNKGIVSLHDLRCTASAMPALLEQLEKRGFSIANIVPCCRWPSKQPLPSARYQRRLRD